LFVQDVQNKPALIEYDALELPYFSRYEVQLLFDVREPVFLLLFPHPSLVLFL